MFKTLIAALILGSSTVAMAQPAFSVGGEVRFTRSSSVEIRDHRNTRPNVRPNVRYQQTRYPQNIERFPMTPSYPSYPTPQIGAGWTLMNNGMAASRATVGFEINAWLGSVQFQGMHGTYDAQVIYADGRVTNLSGMTGQYMANLAPGVISRIIVHSTSARCAPQLMVSASNH